MFKALRGAVHAILQHPADMGWTVQGFGMLRCHFEADKTYRLNIWDSKLAVPGVSVIHDHPWNFQSWIINGVFRNIRYLEIDAQSIECPDRLYDYMTIKTGEGGGARGDPQSMFLHALPTELYVTGATYEQLASEIHMSDYLDGTVTLNERTRVGDGEHARVFWPHGEKWVDAEPRKATWEEIADACAGALDIWQK